jgi:hypothetical protein
MGRTKGLIQLRKGRLEMKQEDRRMVVKQELCLMLLLGLLHSYDMREIIAQNKLLL